MHYFLKFGGIGRHSRLFHSITYYIVMIVIDMRYIECWAPLLYRFEFYSFDLKNKKDISCWEALRSKMKNQLPVWFFRFWILSNSLSRNRFVDYQFYIWACIQGPVVQWENSALLMLKLGFESRRGHYFKTLGLHVPRLAFLPCKERVESSILFGSTQ